MSPDAGRATRRRAAIAAAEELFGAQGFHATGMAEVASRAGISVKSLYECLPSKEALFSAVLEDVADRFGVLFRTRHATPEDPVGALQELLSALIDLVGANTAALRLYSRGTDVVPVALRARGIDPFAAYRRRLESMLADLVRQAQACGLGAGLDAEVTGRVLLTITIAEARRRLDDGSPVAGAIDDLRPITVALLARP